VKHKTQMNYLLAAMLSLASPALLADDVAQGKSLHDENCVRCHINLMGGDGTKIYTRPDRRIEDLPGLKTQVKRCRDSLGFPWPDNQVDDVVSYLNSSFYKFNK